MAFVWMKPRRGLDVLAHERREGLVGDRVDLVDRHLQQRAGSGVHRRLAELVPVHLAESLEPAHLDLAAGVRGLELGQRRLVLQIRAIVLAELGAVQRRLRDVHVAAAHDLGQLAVEEREQQRADVRTVDIGVGHDDDLVVPELREIELLADAGARRGDERLDLLVAEHLVDTRTLDIEDLAADRQDRLEARVARLLGAAAGAVTLDDEEFGLFARCASSSRRACPA